MTHLPAPPLPVAPVNVTCLFTLAFALGSWLSATTASAAVAPTALRTGAAPAAVTLRHDRSADSNNANTLFDAGYFRVAEEACVPLQPGPRTRDRVRPDQAGVTIDNAILHYRWRQVQQRLPAIGSPRPAVPCYYFAP